MREIEFKFVGRNKEFNEIVISEPLTITDILNKVYPSFFSLAYRTAGGNCEFIAEIQYTGLKDKNGKKIFEGDILKCHRFITNAGPYGEELDQIIFCEVFFNAGSFCLKDKVETFSLQNWVIDWKEIIGNVYENPELLEG